MNMHQRNLAFAALVLWSAVSGAHVVNATTFETNLLINPDAEINAMDGWTPVDEITPIDVKVPGTDGLPPGTDIGAYSFTGGLGDADETAIQHIDVSSINTQIDNNEITASLSGLLQSRRNGGALDVVTCTFAFINDSSGIIAQESFVDNQILDGIADWHAFDETVPVPSGTRQIRVTLEMQRNVGVSTDAFADNLAVVLHGPTCAADFDNDGSVASTDLLSLLLAWGPCPGSCPEDLDNDDIVGVGDLLQLLLAWGPCA